MNERFKPPTSLVADVNVREEPSWYRTASLVIVISVVSLGLAWFVVPSIAAFISQTAGFGNTENSPPPAVLAIDLVLTTIVAFVGCYSAARLSRGHYFLAAAGVGLVGALVYFVEVGGLTGMLRSDFPVWYDFFPDDALAALAAWILARRRHER
ncbi:MAG: hypothetical protein ACXWJM_01055 [Ramlibacter sp.]